MKIGIEFKTIESQRYYKSLFEKKGFKRINDSSDSKTLWIGNLDMVQNMGNETRFVPKIKIGFMYDVLIQNEDMNVYEVYVDDSKEVSNG